MNDDSEIKRLERSSSRSDAEVYLKISEFLYKRLEFRASRELRLNLALWTLLTGFTAVALTNKVTIPWPFFFAFPLFHALWINGEHRGHDQYKKELDFWMLRIQLSALGENEAAAAGITQSAVAYPTPSQTFKSRWFLFHSNWSARLQFYATLGLSAAAAFIAFANSKGLN